MKLISFFLVILFSFKTWSQEQFELGVGIGAQPFTNTMNDCNNLFTPKNMSNVKKL